MPLYISSLTEWIMIDDDVISKCHYDMSYPLNLEMLLSIIIIDSAQVIRDNSIFVITNLAN